MVNSLRWARLRSLGVTERKSNDFRSHEFSCLALNFVSQKALNSGGGFSSLDYSPRQGPARAPSNKAPEA